MFILSNKLMKCEKLESYKIKDEYTDDDLEEARKIRNDRMKHAYNIGSTKKAEELADKDVMEFLKNKPKEIILYVNGKYFCTVGSVEKKILLNENLFRNTLVNKSVDIDIYL